MALRYGGRIKGKALKFLCGLLEMSPSARLTADQALMHTYFDDIRKDDVDFNRPLASAQNLGSKNYGTVKRI